VIDAPASKVDAHVAEARPETPALVQAAKANGNSVVVPMQETLAPSPSVFSKTDLEVPAFLRRRMVEQ
jgi:hypothetical protein